MIGLGLFNHSFSQISIAPFIGNGSEHNPYEISCLENLYWMCQNSDKWDCYFVQTTDIEASYSRYWENPWEPIGSQANPFSGNYDGQGYKITNLFINRPEDDNIGFFGVVHHGAEIRRLGLKNIEVIGKKNVGGLAAKISGTGNNITVLREIYVIGKITGNEIIGGISSEFGNNMELKDSYTTVTIKALDPWAVHAGGIAGKVSGNTKISDSFAIADFINAETEVGGLTGSGNANNISGSYYNSDLISQSSTGIGISTEEFMQINSFSGWDLSSVAFNQVDTTNKWNIVEGLTYPFLSWEKSKSESPNIYSLYATEINPLFARLMGRITYFNIYEEAEVYFEYRKFGTEIWSVTEKQSINSDNDFFNVIIYLSPLTEYEFRAVAEFGNSQIQHGSILKFKTPEYVETDTPLGLGTNENPYLINSLNDLVWISENSEYWHAHYKQISDIDASETANPSFNESKGWSPIGIKNKEFKGSFNGQHYKIKNLFINRPQESHIGFFGYIHSGAIITNISLENVDITGSQYTGGIVGYIEGEWDKISEISYSFVTGKIKGAGSTGGIAGYITYNSKIHNSYCKADIFGEWGTGGIAGSLWSTAEIKNSYSVSKVDGTNPGGLGGIIGQGNNNIDNSFYNSDLFPGGGNSEMAKTTALMKDINTYLIVDWDFNSIWEIDEQAVINEGYPYFRKNNHEIESPLPISLKSFKANVEKNAVKIEWTTASEINNDYFSIQRSEDAINFETIEIVQGSGFSNTDLSYFTFDYRPIKGISYYRLKQTDYDGTYEIFDPVVVKFEAEIKNPKLEVFPNPAHNNDFYIRVTTEKSEHINLEVFDSHGLKILHEDYKNTNFVSIHVSELEKNLKPGTYFIIISTLQGRFAEKLVIL